MKSINSKKIIHLLIYFLITIGILIIIFPMYVTIITAFKPASESAKSFFALPSSFYLDNFKNVIIKNNFLIYCINSFVITLFSVIVIVVYIPMISYSIARNIKRKYFKFIYYYIIGGIFLSFQVIMIPLVKLMSNLHLMTQGGLILLYIAFAHIQGVFLFVGYIKAIPLELDESAFIDGCSVWEVFSKIVYPLIKPMTATVAIINSLWIWNDFLLPLLILNRSNKYWTLPLFQYNFKQTYFFDYNLAFASFLLSMLPIIIIYILSQKYIISGLTRGSLKG